MKAYCIKYTHNDVDTTYLIWKIAKSKGDAFKFAFGKAMPKNSDKILTKRGLPITVTEVEEHEVSEVFPISKLEKTEHPKEVSTSGEWML